ncbi:MAG: twin-arginine translocation signal domain-containing protein [Candidatus Paceibacterota bacterium]
MGMEGPNKDNRMSRRDFLRIAGGAVGAYALSVDAVEVSLTKSGEVIPSPEGIKRIFETLFSEITKVTGVENYTEVRKGNDDDGVYLWEVAFPLEDGIAQFEYLRKGRHEIGGGSIATKIYITFFDETGFPEGGHNVAEFSDGMWDIGDIRLPK